jgi:hypothetical protein
MAGLTPILASPVGRAVEPAVGLDLLLQLAGRPAGIAQRQEGAGRAAPAGDRPQDVERGRQAHAVGDGQRGAFREEVGRMEHEPPARLHRPAPMHAHLVHRSRERRVLRRVCDLELNQQVAQTDLGKELVDDDAHGALRRMGADIDHRPGKARIGHPRHRDQKMPVQMALTKPFLHHC